MLTVSSFAAASGAITSIPHPLATYAMAVRKPVIAAINGATAGLGLIYALTCDVRYVAAGAKLTTSFARRGLVAERTLAWLLPRVVGYGAAMDIALSGRVVLAEEALQLGLVNKVLPPEDVLNAAFEWARDVADHCSPGAVEMIKSQLRRSMTQDVLASLQEANALAVQAFQRSDAGEGAASFIAGRDPSFTPVVGPRSALDIAIAGPATHTSVTS
jgi:enoyl-CoA hydratase/carnithine racemase